MTNTPDGNRLPEAPVGMRSRPSDVVANPPVVKTPVPEGAVPAVPGAGVRPGAAPADTPALAAERAARVADIVTDEPRGLTTDQIMPTCMIYSMFAVLAVLLGTMLCWMFNAFGTLIR
jgi:hypothetical protein